MIEFDQDRMDLTDDERKGEITPPTPRFPDSQSEKAFISFNGIASSVLCSLLLHWLLYP